MNRDFLLISFIALLSLGYGAYSSYKMLFENKNPYILSCDGMLLDKAKVYAISNYEKESNDTIYIHYEQSRVIAPSTLGYLYFDEKRNEFVLRNHTCIFNPNQQTPENYFLPFCRTLKDGFFEDGIYFGSHELIPQSILLERGVKYNTAAGNRENRVSLEFMQTPEGLLLRTKDDGLLCQYWLQKGVANPFEIYLNKKIENSSCQNIFSFDNTTSGNGIYYLNILPDLYNVKFNIHDENAKEISWGKSKEPQFFIGEFKFSIQLKFGLLFTAFFMFYFVLLTLFQLYLICAFYRARSPLILALLGFRILINCIAMMAVPLFLTSFHLIESRIWYLPLVLLLNFSFLLPKDIFKKMKTNLPGKWLTLFAWVIILLCPLVFKFGASNESLFGIIPILHCQKAVILLLFFTTQFYFFDNWKYKYPLRIIIILIYALGISFLTSDIGSFIYAGLSILVIEMIRKSVVPKQVIIGLAGIAVVVFTTFQLVPDWFTSERKGYRIVAPYVSPDSNSLSVANQSDRESYSYLLLNLKNILEAQAPEFNEVIIPGNMRSTHHTDFAFHWSLTLGGIYFFILYLLITLVLLSKLMWLLYCSTHICRVRDNLSFAFPQSRQAELVRILLAFTIIGFIYPIASNLLLIPLTGQSIPVLSISNVEIVFLIILFVSLENIFNHSEYYIPVETTYSYLSIKRNVRSDLARLSAVFAGTLTIKYYCVLYTSDTLHWKKHISNSHKEWSEKLPNASNKVELVGFAKKLIGNDKLTSVERSKKPILKNLASLYYSNLPYSQYVHESKSFATNAELLSDQISVDSYFKHKKKRLSEDEGPFGEVYAYTQSVNNKVQVNVNHRLYNCIPFYAQSIRADLTAECSAALENHLKSIGLVENIGAILIADNRTGSILANSSFPLDKSINSNEVYYLIGSLKKTILGYCALSIDEEYKCKEYEGKTFEDFIKNSDDQFAAGLLYDLLSFHQKEFDDILWKDFEMHLYSLTEDAFLDEMPKPRDFTKKLNRNNTIYRQAIGQQRPYQFIDVVQWYARIAGKRKVNLNYSVGNVPAESIALDAENQAFLFSSLHSVLTGTARRVGIALAENGIDTTQFMCKTGTSEKSDRTGNSSSSFIVANEQFTIGIMLKGNLPHNEEKVAAKDLFNEIIPLLVKYEILMVQSDSATVALARH
jgi:hypothetical protein